MELADPEVAAYIARWRPSSVSPQAAAFARQVVPLAAPAGQERAKNLLWAAGKLADTRSGSAWSRCRRCCCTRRWPSGSPGARRG